MIQVARDDGLQQELAPVVHFIPKLRLEHLDGDGPIDRSLVRRIDHADASFADQVQQLIVGGISTLPHGPA